MSDVRNRCETSWLAAGGLAVEVSQHLSIHSFIACLHPCTHKMSRIKTRTLRACLLITISPISPMHTQNMREKARTLRACPLITICYPRLSQFSGRRAGEEDEPDPCSSRGKKRLLSARVQTVYQAYGYVELVSATTVSLTNLYYDGAGGDFCTFCTWLREAWERENQFECRACWGGCKSVCRSQDQLDSGHQVLHWSRLQHRHHRRAHCLRRGQTRKYSLAKLPTSRGSACNRELPSSPHTAPPPHPVVPGPVPRPLRPELCRGLPARLQQWLPPPQPPHQAGKTGYIIDN